MVSQGSVIRAWVHDPQGGNPKFRPLVVITPSHEISDSGDVAVVAITGVFPDPPNDDEIVLPFHPGGQARSGLTKRCVAKCLWQEVVRLDDGYELKGHLPTHKVSEILEKIAGLSRGS